MPRVGKASTLTDEEIEFVLREIVKHRHREKNLAMMLINFRLGLKVSEIAGLKVKDVAILNDNYTDIKIKRKITVAKLYEKLPETDREYCRKKTSKRSAVTFKVGNFNEIIKEVWEAGAKGEMVNPEKYYPSMKNRNKSVREISIECPRLSEALYIYIKLRIDKEICLMPSAPLFVSQKGGAYTPDTMQRHMATIMRKWCDLDGASSHSGRRSLLTKMLEDNCNVAQAARYIAGHASFDTTLTYLNPLDASPFERESVDK